MLWNSWAAAATLNESSLLARRVSCSIFLWRGMKVSFQALHVWLAFGFPYHSGRLLGKELARRRDNVENVTRQLLVIGRPVRWYFFLASSIVMMNWGAWGLLFQYTGSSLIKVTTSVTSRPPIFRRNGRGDRAETPFRSRCLRRGGRCSALPQSRAG